MNNESISATSTIRNIVFDIGDVLLHFQWEDCLRKYGATEDAIRVIGEKWILQPLWDELDMGAIPEDEALSHARAALGEYAGYVDLFMEHMDGIVVIEPEAAPFIRELKERGLGIYLLSNYPRSLFTCHSKKFDFLPYIDGAVVSSHIRLMKPDRRIYEHLLEKYELRAEECIFFDDRPVNIAGALAVGMNAVCFTGMEQARAELRARGLL